MESSLGPAPEAECKLARDAWLQPARVAEPGLTDRERLETALTLEIQRFLGEQHAYRSVSLLPGSPGPDDYLLQFTFPSYDQKLIRCPRCNFWMVVLLGDWSRAWEWEFHSNLSGRLDVETPAGERIATSTLSQTDEDSSSPNRHPSNGEPFISVKARGRLVRLLAWRACQDLSQSASP